jgi:hypothetical protein
VKQSPLKFIFWWYLPPYSTQKKKTSKNLEIFEKRWQFFEGFEILRISGFEIFKN